MSTYTAMMHCSSSASFTLNLDQVEEELIVKKIFTVLNIRID